MKRFFKFCSLLFFLLLIFSENPVFAADIIGAGATFPYPLYTRWAYLYEAKTGIKVNFQAIGSGGGIKQIQAKTVDFGASDKPLSSAELKQMNLVQFPTVVGAVVPVINIPGIQSSQLKLSGSTLADIYLGKIKKWNDPAIKTLNPTLNLPDQYITVVHRSDGSGTTYLFTEYLSKVSDTWKKQVGSDAAIDWPQGIGGKGNEGVSAYVQRVKGAIGYVEFAYTQQNRLVYVALQNKNGHFVAPSLNSFKAATANVNWGYTPDFALSLTDQPGDQSWPIIGATFILMHTVQNKPDQAKRVLDFFNWAFHEGTSVALQLDYIPLPPEAIKIVKNTWQQQIKNPQGNAIWMQP